MKNTLSRVAIVGIGWYGFKPVVPDLSFREMMFEASSRAYHDAGDLNPRKDIDAFISCQEDYWEGIAIADEFAPEPMGGVLRPTFTVAGDGLQGIIQGYMLLKTGKFEVIAVEAHAKPSDLLSLSKIYDLALDPLFVRPLEPGNPFFVSGLDAISYLYRSGASREHLGMVAVKNRNNGLDNPRASYAGKITLEEILNAKTIIEPLTEYDIASFTDAAVTVVLATEQRARELTDNPIWIDGVGWNTETGSGGIEYHQWGRMPFIRMASQMAYKMAGISDPLEQTDFAVVDDRFSFVELIMLEELGIATEGTSHQMLEQGMFERNGTYPVNPGGGSLSTGTPFEATGLSRLIEAIEVLRENKYGITDAERALVASWRGPPTYTGSVLVLST